MKTFNYIARYREGGEVNGVIEANTRDEAIRQLRDTNLIIVQISEVGDSSRDVNLRIGGRKAKEKELSVMCNQFAILLKAGLPIVRTLQLIADQTDDKTLKKVLENVADDVAAGYGLADSFVKHGKSLPTTFTESVRAGESSGSLDAVFLRLKDYYEKSSRSKAKVRSAMVYPTFVIVIAVIVVAIIMIFAVPVFRTTFDSFGGELPAITQAVIALSDFFVGYWWVLILIVGALFILVKVLKKNERFRLAWSKMGVELPILHIPTPVIGRVNLMGSTSQYAGTMGVMMASGMPITKAVDVAAKSMGNYYLAHSVAETLPELEAGKSLATCLQVRNTLPSLAIEMTAVGEQTGSLEHTLSVISEYYDNEVEVATARALAVLEPCIIVVLAVIVFMLLLSVYMPMFTMYGSIG